MNELINLATKQTMTTLEIAELTGKQHPHVLRDVRSLIEQGAIEDQSNFGEIFYTDSMNRKMPMLELDKKACLVLATGYNPVLRAKIIDRWMVLEAKELQPMNEDQLILQAITLLKSRNEKLLEDNTALTIQNKRMVPKAEFYDQVTGSRDAIEMSKVAKVLDIGIGRNKLFAILRDCQVLRADNTPYQAYIDSGYFRVIEQGYIRSDSTKHITFKTLVYQRGLDYIRKFLIRKGYSKNNLFKERISSI